MKNEASGSDDEDGQKFAKHSFKKHQNLFQKNPINMYANDYDDEDDDDDYSSEDSDD